jgi:hypothetical protein
LDRENRIAEEERQYRTGRTGQAEQDRQNGTGRRGQAGEDRQGRTGTWTEFVSQDRTARKGQPERTGRTILP